MLLKQPRRSYACPSFTQAGGIFLQCQVYTKGLDEMSRRKAVEIYNLTGHNAGEEGKFCWERLTVLTQILVLNGPTLSSSSSSLLRYYRLFLPEQIH